MGSAVRLIGGTLGGRRLKSLPGEATRPAMGRTREALFSMLESRGICWQGANVLDLFAGTGSLALECLSRGADWALLVDNGKTACRVMGENVAALDLTSRCRISCTSVLQLLRNAPPHRFQLAFIDPPYRRDYLSPCLSLLCQRAWLAPGAFVAVEMERSASFVTPEVLRPLTSKALGQTTLSLFSYDGGDSHEDSNVSGDI